MGDAGEGVTDKPTEASELWVVESLHAGRWWTTNWTGESQEEGEGQLAAARFEAGNYPLRLRRYVAEPQS